MSNITEIIGFMAAVLTTSSFIPQAVKVIRTRNTEGISLLMYIMFSAGVACWLAYGMLLNYRPMIAANSITLLLASTILAIKLIAPPKKDKK